MRQTLTTLVSLVAATLSAAAFAASLDDPVLDRGEEVYRVTCATSYCHGVDGAAAGAPRLAARDFDAAYIANVIAGGVKDTPMVGFANALSDEDLRAVMTYVARLNGIMNPQFGSNDPLASLGIAVANPRRIPLAGEEQAGRELFFDAYDKGLNRCSTCHEMEGIGIPVAAPIATVPASVRALRNLATPNVVTATLDGDAMPALLLSEGKAGTLFYDLTVVPPVLRTVQPEAALDFADRSDWRHADAIAAYTDRELERVLAFLRAITE